MKEHIFRKSSIDRVNSPEQLNEYIRVTSPSVWLVLGAVVLLLLGTCIWGIFGRIHTVSTVPVVVQDGIATCFFPADGNNMVDVNMEAVVENTEGRVVSVSKTPVFMGKDTDPYVLYLGNFSEGDFCYQATLSIAGLSDGVYEGKIILESIAPAQFVVQ